MTTSTDTIKLVRDLMHIGVRTCPENLPLAKAIRILACEDIESLIVLDENGNAVGLFGPQEVIRALGLCGANARDYQKCTVAEIMQPEIPEIPPDIPVTAAAQIMLDQNIREIYLMHHDRGFKWPAAVLRLEDILSYLTYQF